MKKFDVVLFDFDGTIADTSPGIKEGLRHTFELNSMPILEDEEMNPFIGPPLDDSFVNFCGVEREKAWDMVLQFREHYHNKAINKFLIYDKLESGLKILKNKGIVLGVATSKPEMMAVHILKEAKLYEYFDVIQGANLDGSLIKKTDIVAHVLNKEKIKGKHCLMVGDTAFDIIGAHKNNIECMWVGYGFGTKEDAIKANAEYIADTQEEMIEFFKSL